MSPNDMKELVSTVVEQSTELEASLAAERAARARLLDQTIDIVRPALEALASKIWASRTYDVLLNETQVRHFPFRGLELFDDTRRRTLVTEQDGEQSGEYRGTLVLLGGSGQLYLGNTSGGWSDSTNEDHRERVVADATSLIVVTRAPVHRCIEAIERALTAYAEGNAQKVALKAREMAERLHAVSVLLRS